MAKAFKVKKVHPDTPAAKTATRILLTRLNEFYSHWPNADDEPTAAEIHNLRISGKRLRYSAESTREFYPDRLALLIELLKRGQDILGDYQDCVTHRAMLSKDLARQRRLSPRGKQIALLEKLLAALDERQAMLFAQFREIWRGMVAKEFRKYLKAAVAEPFSRG
ncbi:MAG: CHAD domain-containing protein [Acidobacteria bacterium]|nr:CHAD domain-containing protein [Acidobacteriota bacterium]MBI3425382.1 CHAD domain-containing protein [Acidobacteriota bacterium]